ncbi:MAG: EF-hand domain-containing protein, partial [Candidatus Paceibacterota bacterium]
MKRMFALILAMIFTIITPLVFADGTVFHSADTNQDGSISLSELLRVVQFFNSDGYHCDVSSEDGYAPGPGGIDCGHHNSDYYPADWCIDLSELLRLVQIFNTGTYSACASGEDGFALGSQGCPVEG